MAIKRYGVQNPAANTEVTLVTTNDPLLLSVIATNKHASAEAEINVFVVPNGTSNPSQYSYIAYALPINIGNSVETHRFAVNAGDTVKVSSSIQDVSFTGMGIPQTDVLPADEVQVFTNKTISGLSNTLTNIGNSSLTNSQITLMGEQMDLGETVANLDYFQFDTAATPASAAGRLTWDDGEGTVSLGLKGGNINLQVGQENVALCHNGTGSTITKGSVVYISGAQGQRPSITLSDADTEAASSKTFGVVAENIADGAEGFVCTFGIVTGLNTASFTAGQSLWLSSTAGGLTNTAPSQPAHLVFIGYCLSSHATTGRIFVNPQNGYELHELHNVLISSPSNGQALVYESATSLWKNTTLDLLPSQTGNSGKYLTTNGTTASWGTISGAVYSADAPASPTVGQLWIESDVDVNTYNAQIITRWSKTLTGTESSFSGVSGGVLLQYTVGYEQVYLNGVLLLRGTDYTASDGLTIVLTTAAASGDVIEVICPNNFTSVNTYTQSQIDTSLALKANIASPALTGIPTAPTAAAATNTTQIATTAFVRTEVSNLVASAPSTLDTLNELATALGNDPNFATTVTNSIATKASTGKAIAMAMVFGG